MRLPIVSLCFAFVVVGCDCGEEPIRIAEGEGEGGPLPTEGEGEVGGEGEGEEGEGEEGEGEGEGDEGEGEGEGEAPACSNAELIAPGSDDKPRTLLLGFPFAANSSGPGTDVGAYAIGLDGLVTGETDRVSVGFLPDRIAFVPSGRFAIVVGESLQPGGGGQRPPDRVAVIDVEDPDNLVVVDDVDSGVYGLKDVVITSTIVAGGVAGYAVNFDSGTGDTPAGVLPFSIDCTGAITLGSGGFLERRLSSSLALLPGNRGLLLGGQVINFQPTDDRDVRLLNLAGGAVTETGAFDIFADDVVASRIAAADDGSFAVLPNNALGSDDTGDVVIVDIGAGVTERGRIDGLFSASEVVIAPDRSVAAVSQYESGTITILDVTGAGDPTVATTLTGLGLAEQMARTGRGPLAGRVYVPIVSAAEGVGSSIAAFDLGGGTAVRVNPSFSLGDGTENTPVAVAISP